MTALPSSSAGYAELTIAITADGATQVVAVDGDPLLVGVVATRIARAVEPATRIRPPAPGRTVLGCRCGRTVNLDDLRRPPLSRPNLLDPIVCKECA